MDSSIDIVSLRYKEKKSRLQETLNLLTCADRSTDTKKIPPPQKKKRSKHVTCHLSFVICHMSCFVMSCHVMSCLVMTCHVLSCHVKITLNNIFMHWHNNTGHTTFNKYCNLYTTIFTIQMSLTAEYNNILYLLSVFQGIEDM